MDFKNTFMIGGWVAPPPTKKNYITLSRCGLNAIFLVGSDNEEYKLARRHLAAAKTAGVLVFIGGGNNLDRVAAAGRRFKNFDNVAGVNVYDEPTAAQKSDILAAAKKLKRANPKRDFYINLLPSYTVPSAIDNNYRQYVEDYAYLISTVEKNGWLSFDFYPLEVDGSGKRYLNQNWLCDVETIAAAAKKYGLKPHFFIQSMSFGGTISTLHDRKPTIEDIRLQIYVYLAYGARGYTHFCYQSPVSPEFNETQTGLILGGKKTERWKLAQKVNSEVLAFAPILMKLKWQGTVKIFGKKTENPVFSKLDNYGFSSCEFMKSVKSDETLMAGVYKGEGKEGYVLVNFAETSENITAKMHVTFKKPTLIKIYKKGKEKIKTAKKTATFVLEKGEGIVIIALNA